MSELSDDAARILTAARAGTLLAATSGVDAMSDRLAAIERAMDEQRPIETAAKSAALAAQQAADRATAAHTREAETLEVLRRAGRETRDAIDAAHRQAANDHAARQRSAAESQARHEAAVRDELLNEARRRAQAEAADEARRQAAG